MTSRTPVDDLTRAAIFHRDGGRCVYCLASIDDTDMELDHLIASSRGGSNLPINLVTACAACNNEKGVVHVKAYILDRKLTGKNHRDILPRITAQVAKPLDLVAALETLGYLEYLRRERAPR
jgi:5-methylcytosine-specific restriction endonuclease McrA